MNNSKGFALDMTRTSLNYRPSSNFRESVKSNDGVRGKPNFDLLFSSVAMTDIPNRRTNFQSFIDTSTLKLIGKPQMTHRKGSVAKKQQLFEQNPTIQFQMLELRKTLFAKHKGLKENTDKSSHKKFLSYFVDNNFGAVEYSLLPKDQVLNRLLAQLDFSLVHLISFLSENMPNKFYKLHQVCSLFDQDFKADCSERLQFVVTKEMVLHQFVPESKILRMKMLNKNRMDNPVRLNFSIKTRTLISEVLRQSFDK